QGVGPLQGLPFGRERVVDGRGRRAILRPEASHANLGSSALFAERSAVFDRRAAFVANMLHRNSRYSSPGGGARKRRRGRRGNLLIWHPASRRIQKLVISVGLRGSPI